MKEYRVLVTSIGGDLGKAVCKALQISKYPIKIIGTDCKYYEPFPLFCDEFKVIPRANDMNYLNFINEYIVTHNIDLVYVCSEQELFYICDHLNLIKSSIHQKLVILPINVVNLCRDKFKTTTFLKKHGFPYAPAIPYNPTKSIDELLENFTFPLIVKKKIGCGSKNVYVIHDKKDFKYIPDLDNTYMIQNYIFGTEYTNAVYVDYLTGNIYVLTFERFLKDGMSYEVKVVFDKEIEKLCKRVSKALNIRGSINIQLRKQNHGKPIIFEINPRYSSTSFMRANFGFNDVIYAFENIVLTRPIVKPKIKRGFAYRYITEFYKFDKGE
ncbi:MAG: ATP-grasp domain-containing protein [Marinisporobacter sp.]|nr:ATP-grasp domain-containing protein [Marinisporobacter sp.]